MSREKIEKIGLKDLSGKPMIDLVTADSIIGMAEVLTYGAKKYKPNSWQNVKNGKNVHYASMMRHLLAWKNGEIFDKETGLSHLKHAMTNCMFLLYHENKILNPDKKLTKQDIEDAGFSWLEYSKKIGFFKDLK